MHAVVSGRRRRRSGTGQVVLYDAATAVLLLFLAFAGLVALLNARPAGDKEQRAGRVVIVEPSRPPGQSRIPPGQLKKYGYVRVVTMTPSVAARYRVRYQQGVLITEVVVSDGPGMTLLLERLDVIVAVNGEPVTTEVQLRTHLKRHKADEWVKLTVWRDGRLITVLVPVEAFEVYLEL